MEIKDMTNPAALAAFANGDIENALVASTPGGIEAQEKRGQQTLVQSTDMPLELRPNKEAFEKVGFTFGAVIDAIFQEATLPPGWSREASDHDMWSYIKDDQGRRRVAVFYKAAFYDRRASANLECRYHAGRDYNASRDVPLPVGVFDQGKMFWKAGEEPRGIDNYDRAHSEALGKAAEDHLNSKFPDWADPTAYW